MQTPDPCPSRAPFLGKTQILKQKVTICSAKCYGRHTHSMFSLEKGVKKYFKTDLLRKMTLKMNSKILLELAM